MDPTLELSNAVAGEIVSLAGLKGPVQVTRLKTHNHVYRVTCGADALFLKTYTKDWYGDDIAATAGVVEHEAAAYRTLAAHGLATPDIVLERRDCHNPWGRPFLATRQLPGYPLTHWLDEADERSFHACLEAVGDYLRRMHAITYAYPGYIMDQPPSAPLRADQWQHPSWSAQTRQADALRTLEGDRGRLSPGLYSLLQQRFRTMAERLAPEYEPPRFTHGDCHAHQFFLQRQEDQWRVAGVVDMEVASAGDGCEDLLKCGVELALRYPVTQRWWESLFRGYRQEPDFDLFRLRWLGWAEINFTCYNPQGWTLSREEHLQRLLTARTWAELFDWR